MGERRLNFPEHQRQTEGSPHFAPLAERSQYVDPVWIVLSFGIVVGVTIFLMLVRFLKRKLDAESKQARARHIPVHVYGRDEEIRERLEKKKREEREGNGTWKLELGEPLRVSVPRVGMAFPATVTQIAEDGFVAELPMRTDDKHQPVIGDHVRGFLLRGDFRWSFDSSVSMIYLTGTNGVRIGHTKGIRITDRRVQTPVHLRVRVRYGVLRVNPEASGPVLLSSVEDACEERYLADLNALTMRGCTIQTKTAEVVEKGDLLRMRTHLVRDEEEMTMLSEVESVEPYTDEKSSGLMVDVRFLVLDETARMGIERTIHMHQKEVVI